MTHIAIKLIINLMVFVTIGLLCWGFSRIITEAMQKYEQTYVDKTSRTLTGMFIFMDPKRLFYLNIIITVVSILIASVVSDSWVIVGMVGLFSFSIPKLWIHLQIRSRISKFDSQLVDTLVMMSSALRSGMSLVQSIELVEREQDPPTSQEFGLVLREYKVGVHLEDALDHLSARIQLEELKIMVVSINIVLEAGGNITDMLDTLADVIRNRKKLDGKVKSLTAQGKMQAVVVSILPNVLGVLMYFLDPVMMERMWTTTLGIILLGIMVGLQVLGFFSIRKITALEY